MKNKKYNQIVAILMAITMGCTSIPTTAFATELPSAATVSEDASAGEQKETNIVESTTEASTENTTESSEAVTEEPMTLEETQIPAVTSETDVEDDTEEIPPTEETEDLVYDISWYKEQATEFELDNALQLVGLAVLVREGNTFSGKTIKLKNDIDAGGVRWLPIGYRTRKVSGASTGTVTKEFQGTFDGQSHSIVNVVAKAFPSDPHECLGVFGNIGTGGVVRNLQIKNSEVTVTEDNKQSSYHGGVVAWNSGTVENCSFEGTVVSNASVINVVGGIIGYHSSGTVKECTFKGTVQNDSKYTSSALYTGGIVGQANKGSIYYSTVKKDSVVCAQTGYVGGIVGATTNSNIKIKGCVNDGDVSITGSEGTNYAGGINGYGNGMTLVMEGNTNNGTVSGACNYAWIGGISPSVKDDAKIHACVNTGKLSYATGGAIYGIGNTGIVSDCYTTSDKVGGKTISNCYALKMEGQTEVSGVTYLFKEAFTDGTLLAYLNQLGPIWGAETGAYPKLKDTAIFDMSLSVEGLSSVFSLQYDKEKAAYIGNLPGIDLTTLSDKNFSYSLFKEDAKVTVSAANTEKDEWSVKVSSGTQEDTYKVLL